MGAHEPPTRRSFYLSLGASTLRFAIIIALVIGGIVVIDQAFPALSSGDDGGTVPLTGGTPAATGPTATGPAATGGTGGQPERTATVTGVRIAVFNGAGVSGLAADTQEQLVEGYGYVAAQNPADAPAEYPVTTIYYRAPKDKVEAEYLAGDFFKKLKDIQIQRLEPGTADIDRSAQLAIFLGIDYGSLKSG